MDKPKKTSTPSPNPNPKVTATPGPGYENAVNNQLVLGVIIALIVVLLTILYVWSRKSKKGRSILFVGPCDAGKTAIFGHVVSGQGIETVTSVVPNECEFVPENGKAALILKDLPGHDRVRVKWWDSNKIGVRGIVCVVDAAAGSKAIREAAEVLYGVLTDSTVNSVRPNILVFANKQDLPTAKAVKVIRTQLEREITTLRMTKSGSLQTTTGNSAASSKTLGKMDRDFDFEHVLPIKVEFGEGCGKGDETELKTIFDWLNNVA